MNKTWLLIVFFCISQPGYGFVDYQGSGKSLSECVQKPTNMTLLPLKESDKSVECVGVAVLDETPLLNNIEWLSLTRSAPLTSSTSFIYGNIKTLSIYGKGWTPEDLATLASHFPNVYRFICEHCDLYQIGVAKVFKNLTTVNLEMLTTVPLKWEGPLSPEGEFTFDGLPYDQVGEINLDPSVETAISCNSIGVWSHKVYQGYWFHNHLPSPYKDYYGCYPEIEKISGYLLEGDGLYKKGNYQSAHDLYYKAFLINPYNQKVISSLSLTFYKLKEFCKAAQVAVSGTKLENGDANTRASIWFNYALSLKQLGLTNEYIDAIRKSNNIKPTPAKEKMIEEGDALDLSRKETCDFQASWIQDIKLNIEKMAVSRSRGKK